VEENNKHFDLNNSKIVGLFKEEAYLIKEFTALNPKVYSIIHEHFDKDKKQFHNNYNTKKLKGVSKAVVKNNIKHTD
jgi:hypothetical protein